MVVEVLPQRYTDFRHELTVIINKYGMDADADMYDRVIADYLINSLEALRQAIQSQRHLERK